MPKALQTSAGDRSGIERIAACFSDDFQLLLTEHDAQYICRVVKPEPGSKIHEITKLGICRVLSLRLLWDRRQNSFQVCRHHGRYPGQ